MTSSRLKIVLAATAGMFVAGITALAQNLTVVGNTQGLGNASFNGDVNVGATASNNLNVKGAVVQDNGMALKAKNASNVAEPWIVPRNSENKTLSWFGANGWSIKNNSGSSVMFMTNGGKVGLNNDAPQYTLDVNGPIAAGNSDLYFTNTTHTSTPTGNTAGYASIQNASDYNTLMILGRAGTSVGRRVDLWDFLQVNGNLQTNGWTRIGAAAQMYTGAGGGDSLGFRTAETDYAFIKGEGIGTWDDGGLGIHVGDDQSAYFRIVNDAYGEILRTTGAGNVGIGTTDPKAKLEVVGRTHISRDGAPECCSNGDYSLSIAESTSNTGRRSSIQFHNYGQDEGYIQLAPSPRRFVFGDHQGISMGGEFTGSLKTAGTLRARGGVQLGASIELIEKEGNNGTASCADFCSGSQWANWSGTCIAAFRQNDHSPVSCTATNSYPYPLGLNCLCVRSPWSML